VKDDRASRVPPKWLGDDISRLAQAYFHVQNYSAAESNAEEACRVLLFSTSKRSKRKLLSALQVATESELMLWKYEEAEHTCQILAALDRQYNGDKTPLQNRILLDLARAQIGSHKYNDAHKTLDPLLSALRREGGWPYIAALAVLGDLDTQEANFEDASKTYQQAIDAISAEKSHFNTVSQSTYFDCALAEYHAGHIDAAEKHLAEAVRLDSNPRWTAAALSYLAALYRRKGDEAAANQTIEKFVAVRNRLLNDKLSGSFTDVLADGKPVAGVENWIVSPVKHVADVNKDVVDKMLTGLRFVPEGVKQHLRQAAILIVLVPTMQYLTDDLNRRPPGYESGSTTSNEQAHTSSDIGAVIMAERYRPVRDASWIDAPDVSESIRHELGHALDHYLLQFSDDNEFVQAYASDTKNVPPKLKRSLAYLLQPGSHGRRETFASLVALEWGSQRRSEELKAQFPRCIQVVQKCLSNLDKPVNKPPAIDPSMSMRWNFSLFLQPPG
jgi:hypothetical protein